MDLTTISTGNPGVDRVIGLAGTFVTVCSFVAGSLNQKIRATMDSEGEAPRLFLWIALALNLCAVNLDKAVQMQKLLKGLPIQKTVKPGTEGDKKPEEPKA